MGVYNDVLTAVIGLIMQTQPYSDVRIGPLPPKNGLAIAWASSSINTFLNKCGTVQMTAVLNGKHANQKVVSDTLGRIHTYLGFKKQYPEAVNFQITDISTISAPSYLGCEENNQWLYGSSIRVKFYLRGE